MSWRRLVPQLRAGAGIEEGSVAIATEAPDVAPGLPVLLPGRQGVEVQLAVDALEEGERAHRAVPGPDGRSCTRPTR